MVIRGGLHALLDFERAQRDAHAFQAEACLACDRLHRGTPPKLPYRAEHGALVLREGGFRRLIDSPALHAMFLRDVFLWVASFFYMFWGTISQRTLPPRVSPGSWRTSDRAASAPSV